MPAFSRLHNFIGIGKLLLCPLGRTLGSQKIFCKIFGQFKIISYLCNQKKEEKKIRKISKILI